MKADLPKILRKGVYRNNIEDETGVEVARIGLFALNDESNPTAEALRDLIVDRYNAAPLVVQVEVKNVYGNETIYPANNAGRIFAAIAGKKTLDRYDLIRIRELGFTVEQAMNKIDL